MINSDRFVLNLNSKKLLIVVVSLQLAFLGLIALDSLGLGIPILRQVIGFLYLTFVPGMLLLGVLKINNLNLTEAILYSVGLSLSFLMGIGTLINSLYPFIGISKPISELPLTYTISFTVILLCIIYYQNKEFELLLPNLGDFLSPSILLFILPILLAVFGTYLLQYHESNLLFLLLLVLISLVPPLAIYHVSSKFYPLLIIGIAFSLILYESAASPYIRGWDACVELYTANLVKANSLWNPRIPISHNAMLSIVILRPIYSILLGTDLTKAFTLTSPFLFSLVPIALYEISRRVVKSQSREEIAFLSCSFFMFFWKFYTSMANYRQQIAMFFLSLIILLLTDRKMKASIGRKVLLIIFSISLVVSHYATAYLYMFILLAALLLSALKPLRKLFSFESISSNYIALFIAIIITWYIYTSGGTLFDALVNIGNNIISAVSAEFLNPEHTDMFWVVRELPSISYRVVRLLHYISFLFIIVGFLDCLRTLLKGKRSIIEKDHLSFSAILLGMLAVMTTVPYASPIGMARTYQLFLLWLAPLCIVGGLVIIRAFKLPRAEYGLRLLAVFFAIFLLFNSGFIPEMTGEYQYQPSLAKAHINDRDFDTKVNFYSCIYTEQEIFAAKWLSDNRELEFKVYADGFHSLLYGYAGIPMWKGLPPKGSETVHTLTKDTLVDETSYVYLRQINLAGVMLLKEPKKGKIAGKINWWNISDLNLNIMSKIYTNSGSAIYYR